MITICYPTQIVRRPNSANGNPSYKVKVMNDWYYTKPNAGFVYGVVPSLLIGKRVVIDYHVTPKGRKIIDNMERG